MAIFKNTKSSMLRAAFSQPHDNSTEHLQHKNKKRRSCGHRNQGASTEATRVTFREKTRVREVIRAQDLAENPNDLWLQEADYKRIGRKALSIVRAIENDSYHREGKQICIRGLEHHLARNRDVIKMRRNEAWESVFEEQSMQQAAGKGYNEELMSAVYVEFSMEAQFTAHEKAARDAKDAERYKKKKPTNC
eukprot:CAMPEP_0117030944 /NCGR_PEP_ID=MMETSP0472-20121206/22294_1 /TAXON_ID=693140 ORGANISM="Tiarina fusus, Strain LIS" /NCGR_SAMPLE_ID=MMETSP0472 /ASSEMBLY_ACC=CAM_ASM_000603 /LENGTH=191 /DNA_ID=CAMNT_0004739159 /DNA_START=40 /DNA_END=615 /DNA_ORIENTATION=-